MGTASGFAEMNLPLLLKLCLAAGALVWDLGLFLELFVILEFLLGKAGAGSSTTMCTALSLSTFALLLACAVSRVPSESSESIFM